MMLVVFLSLLTVAVSGTKCPARCTCSSTSISCSGLTTFPSLKNRKTTSLTIRESNISIPANAFKDLPKLTTIKFQKNKIAEIHSCSFKNMKIQSIHFHQNDVDKISPGAFWDVSGYSSYSNVNFLYGRYGIIASNAFNRLNIYQLQFGNLNITTLKKYSLTDKVRLRYLYLDNSNITNLESNAIDIKRGYLYFRSNSVMNVGCLAFPAVNKYFSSLTVRCDCDLLPIIQRVAIRKVHCFRQSQLYDVILGYSSTCTRAPPDQPTRC